jgi:RNA polymerase sigma-70 factor (ECF subfamily)
MPVIGPQQLARILDEQGGALVLYARQWCPSGSEDVVQEAMVQLARQDPPPERIAAWLYRVVRNSAISAARAERRRRKYEAAAAIATPWFAASHDDRLDTQAAQAALQRLSPEQRETIVARLWGGLTFDEIAEVTGSSSSSAHRWFEAGLAALRKSLGVTCPEKKTKLKS